MESTTIIDDSDFISYKDAHNFIYGFSINSVVMLIEKTNKNNPYTMEPLCETFINTINKRKIYNKIFKQDRDIVVINQSINNKFVSLFQTMDSLGNYTHVEWMTKLNNKTLRKFIIEIHDLWTYRCGLTSEEKYKLCPPDGYPFNGIPINIFNNKRIYIESNTLKDYIFLICDRLINNPTTNTSQKSMCAIYILTSLTLVNKNAAEALPWLYQSVI